MCLITCNFPISLNFAVVNPVVRYKRSIHHPHIDYDSVTRAKLSEWLYGAPPLNIPETILNAIQQTASDEDPETFVEDNKLGEHIDHSDEILKYVVNSIVEDALPKAFRESMFEQANANRVKRGMKENNTGNMNMDDITEWLTDIRPDVLSEFESKSDNVTTPNNGKAMINLFLLYILSTYSAVLSIRPFVYWLKFSMTPMYHVISI